MRRFADLRGFTLIELVFVVVLLGLFSSFALPRIGSVTGINLRSGASKVAAFLQAAYEQSVMRHESIRIRFDMAEGVYWAESQEALPLTPLLDADTKLDEAIRNFEEIAEKSALSPEEKAALDRKRYQPLEIGHLKKARLPMGIRFKTVWVSSDDQPSEGSTPWIDFSPSGFGPKVIVCVMNHSGDVFSILLPPLGGRSRILKGEVDPKDV